MSEQAALARPKLRMTGLALIAALALLKMIHADAVSVRGSTGLFQNEMDFSQENLLSEERPRCGWSKCLFLLKGDSSLGYIAAYTTDACVTMQKGWELAEKITELGMDHIFVAPPKVLTHVQGDFRLWLSKNATTSRGPVFYLSNRIPVQLVRLIREGTGVVLGFIDGKYEKAMAQTKYFLQDLSLQPYHVRQVFLEHFDIQMKKLWALLELYPCLVRDLQIFLTRQGDIVHLDLDRCFSKNGDQFKTAIYASSILGSLRNWNELVTQQLRRNAES